ncbi:MAG: Endoribonuclease YbeY [Syntrophomonadaceae bacterium]|nr:Endoribonuclease YbeY [Bacillota bacterium]
MKKLNCQVFNETKRKLDLTSIKKKLLMAHSKFHLRKYFGRINVVFVGDKKIKQLNSYYLKKDGPTDVLSFYYATPPDISGDIFISVPQAARQSKSLHSLDIELLILAVHGFLHLAGYTDYDYKKYLKMWRMQEKIVNNLCQ